MKKILLSLMLLCPLVGHSADLQLLKNPPSREEARAPSQAAAKNFVHQAIATQPDAKRIQAMLSKLDLSQPRLKEVKKLFDKGQYAQSLSALLAHYKQKQFVTGLPKTAGNRDYEIAEDALSHYLRGNKAIPHTFRGYELDWHSPGFLDGKEITELEWGYQYHRMYALNSLAKAFVDSENEDYAYEWLYQVLSYKQAHFPITPDKPTRISRGMETFYRVNGIIMGFELISKWDQFNESLLLELLESIHHQTQHIRVVYAEKGNHLVGELMEVFQVGAMFDEFALAKQWRSDGLKRIPEMMMLDSYSDGMNKELVFSYHTMYLHLYTKFYELVKKLGFEDQLPSNYVTHLKKMYEFPIAVVMPDLSYPQFGDGWKTAGYYRKPFAKGAKLFPEVEAFHYFSTNGKKGKLPERKLYAYPESGIYALRQGFGHKDAIAVIKNGAGEDWWHNQPDNMTFTFRALGREFMNDSGTFVYGSKDPKVQAERDWFRKTSSHQTLTINGKNAARKPQYLGSIEAEHGLSVMLQNQSYPELSHRRTITLLDNQYLVVVDEAIGTTKEPIELNFQLVPSDVQMDKENLTVTTQFSEGPNLTVQTRALGHKQADLVKQDGFISYKQLKKSPRPAWSIVQPMQGKSLAWVTVIAPFEGDKPSISADVQLKGKAQQYQIRIGEKDYQFQLAL